MSNIARASQIVWSDVSNIFMMTFNVLWSFCGTCGDILFCFQELGNNILENSKSSEVLQEILTPATIMVVSVTASTTQGLVPSILIDQLIRKCKELVENCGHT